MSDSPWDVANNVLYSLCTNHPKHQATGPVIAKVNLIGRTYAAAIERGKSKATSDDNDDFYVRTVGPAIVKSAIDDWLARARNAKPRTEDGFATMVDVHARTTDLFNRISGLDKRSLASKYLHFHVPDLFFIYDSRAVGAMSTLSHLIPRASRTLGEGDNEYRKFSEKCGHLVQHCQDVFGVTLTPRQLDNLLLRVAREG